MNENDKLSFGEQKKLVEKLIKAANKIQNSRKPSASYVHLTEEFIQKQADEKGISFEAMCEIIRNELNPEQK
jgi:hypothetical protein